ncbi:uncharacterized protein LOC105424075 isoform X2 [Pogonomyrmex barbatus]|uniref:Uncharacterized protein LOC105424075 isoform X2 n=1 Tax=Pogonomyrmex barbatus TaxID=144034 RepID=A0A8N1S5F7_9HYME|nr:uncharacterized protein LOC105424075 isoform X2 [Pogonomyrmex barbatus]
MAPSTGCLRDFLVTFLQLGHPAFMFVFEDTCLSIAFYYHSFTDASLIYSNIACLRRSDERIVLNGCVVKLKPAVGDGYSDVSPSKRFMESLAIRQDLPIAEIRALFLWGVRLCNPRD